MVHHRRALLLALAVTLLLCVKANDWVNEPAHDNHDSIRHAPHDAAHASTSKGHPIEHESGAVDHKEHTSDHDSSKDAAAHHANDAHHTEHAPRGDPYHDAPTVAADAAHHAQPHAPVPVVNAPAYQPNPHSQNPHEAAAASVEALRDHNHELASLAAHRAAAAAHAAEAHAYENAHRVQFPTHSPANPQQPALPAAQVPTHAVDAAARAHVSQQHPMGTYHIEPAPAIITNAPEQQFISMTVPTSDMHVHATVPPHVKMHQPEHFRALSVRLLDSPIAVVRWAVKRNPQGRFIQHVVFAVTAGGQLYRSKDAGHTWDNQSQLMQGQRVVAVHVSKADPVYVAILTTGNQNFFSSDAGETYHAHEGHMTDVKHHPTRAGWLLGSNESQGCAFGRGQTREEEQVTTAGDEEDALDSCFYRLLVTKDNGETWKQILTHVVQFDWAPSRGSKNEEGHHTETEDAIFAATYLDEKTSLKLNQWDKNIHFIESNDYFETHEVLVPHGNRFFVGHHGFLFVAAVNPTNEHEVSLKVRHNGTNTFETAHIPVQDLTQHSYTVLDTSERQAFIHVNHAPLAAQALSGHLYISDINGTMYSLSLPNIHRSPMGQCAFAKVEGLEGIYLANYIVHSSIGQNIDIEADSGMGQDSSSSSGGHAPADKVYAQTSITYNKGGEWYHLEPPARDCFGHPIHCEPTSTGIPCKLHLHGLASDDFGPFYSDERCPGIIMATGSVGHYVHQHKGGVNTYLSRDGGLSWVEVFKGSHIYELGDHGGLIAMADDSQPTDVIYFSWDEGATWEGVKITSHPFMVDNIIIEPDNVNIQFVIYGHLPSSNAGVTVFVDFGDLHQRVCTGHAEPGAPTSDYEMWTPHDERMAGRCLMGHETAFLRRKQAAKCFNPLDRVERSIYRNCPCTEHDFQCDYGFVREHENGPCVVDHTDTNYPTLAAVLASRECDGMYLATKGYRRVPGNTCIGGEQWEPELRPCPGRMRLGMIIFIGVIVIGLAAGLVVLHNKYDLGDLMLSIVDKFQGKKSYVLVTPGSSSGSSSSSSSSNAHGDTDSGLELSEDEQTSLSGRPGSSSGLGSSASGRSVSQRKQAGGSSRSQLGGEPASAMDSPSEDDSGTNMNFNEMGGSSSSSSKSSFASNSSIGPLPSAASSTPSAMAAKAAAALATLPAPPPGDAVAPRTQAAYDLLDRSV